MKLTVEKEAIINGLQTAASIIPAKAGAAFLRSIWLNASDGKLSLMATDANLEFTGIYTANIESGGMTGVQGRPFVDLLRLMPDGKLHLLLEENGNILRIEQGRRYYKLPVASPEWFQDFSPYPGEEGVIWTGSVFGEYIDKVSFSISDEDSADALGCLCLKPRGKGRIDICGLNGHQFAMASFINDMLEEKLPEKGLLIERKYLAELRKWLGQDEIELKITEKYLYLKREDAHEILAVPRAHYEYPDYNVFMEKLNAPDLSHLALGRQDAMAALGRLVVFNTEQERAVALDLKPQEVKFSVKGSDMGSARESLEADYSGSLEYISLPTKSMLEIFGHFASDNVDLVFTGQEGPCGITGADDPDYIVIIMPMKIARDSYYSEDE